MNTQSHIHLFYYFPDILYATDNICIPPKLVSWNPDPQCDDIMR